MKKWLLAGAAALARACAGMAPAHGRIQGRTSRRHDAPRRRARLPARIDPHINYTLQYWQIYQSIYDGLVTFKKAPGAEGFARSSRPRRGTADADQ